MGCIEFLIVLAMASLYFSIVPWCVGLDQLVTNIKLLQVFFKERWLGIFSADQPICEFAAIICLHTFDGVGKTLHTMLNKQCGRIGAVFWESLQIAKPGVFINTAIEFRFRRKRYKPGIERVYPLERSLTQNTTIPAFVFRRRIFRISLISSGVC